jgi:acetyl xylan esterase
MNWKRVVSLFVAGISGFVGAAELIWCFDMNNPQIRERIGKCPYAKVSKDFEGTDVLTLKVPPEALARSEFNTVVIPLNLQKLGIPGQYLIMEGDIRYEAVSKPHRNYNGIKCQFSYMDDGKRQWKEFYKTKDATIRYGSLPVWTHFRGSIQIRKGSSQATLNLGLQESYGTIEFRNLRLFKGESLPVSTLELSPVPQAEYTIPASPRMRGVMSPNTFREQDFADLQKWGVNLIRWQIKAPRDLPPAEWIRETRKRAAILPEVLAAGEKYGIKVLIDLHSSGGRQVLSSREGGEFLVEFWKEIAAKYKGHPAVWGYDLLNEPHSRYHKPGLPSWNELADRTIRAIRKIDPVTPVIVEPDQMANPHMLEYLPVFPYPNIIYSIHTYTPGSITHQLDPRAKKFVGYPDGEWDKRGAIREWLEPVREFQRKTGARIYVGEFGCVRWAPGAADYIRDSIEFFEECGWDWTYHAFREWHGWSAEHSDDPSVMTPVPMTKRKEVLLKAFEKNRK